MLRSILGGIFASTLFLTTNATAQSHLNETHYFLHLRTKNGSPSGESYSSRDFLFENHFNQYFSASEAGVSVASEEGKHIGDITFARAGNEPLGLGQYRSEYARYDNQPEIRIGINPGSTGGQTFGFHCSSDEKQLDNLIISRLDHDPSAPDKLKALKIDFSKSCVRGTLEVTDFITGSIVMYERQSGTPPTEGLEAQVEMNYWVPDAIVSEVYTDATHNVWFEPESNYQGGGYTLYSSPKSASGLDREDLLSLWSGPFTPQSPLAPVSVEVHKDHSYSDSMLELRSGREGYLNGLPENRTIRMRLSDVEHARFGHTQQTLKTVNLEYAVFYDPNAHIPASENPWFEPPQLLAFGTVRLSSLPQTFSSLADKVANLMADNTALTEQNSLLNQRNSELDQSLSHERGQSQGLREQLEKQKAETAKFQSERDGLAEKLAAATKEIRDLKLALDSSPQALRLARQRLAMAQSTIAKLTQENSVLTQSLGSRTRELSSLRLALRSLTARLQALSQVICKNSPTCQRAVTQVSAETTRLANP